MPLFALQYRFPEDGQRRLAVRPDHRAYLEELQSRGHVVAAGPFDDDSGALIIYAVDDEEQLERLLADDPYVQHDVFGTRSIHEWRPFIVGDLSAD
jgi:uncharacterized protein YciI